MRSTCEATPTAPGPPRAPPPHGRSAWRVPTLAVALTLLLLLVGSVPTSSAAETSGGPAAGAVSGSVVAAGPAPSSATAIAVIVNTTALNLSDLFLGTTVSNEVHLLRGEADDLNATPAHVIVWPGAMAGEDYNPLTNVHYDTYNGAAKTALTNESQFVAMCRAIHCTAIMQVPAEIDDPSLAEAIVNYTEVNLSFRPAFWMIGNEPELWSHWKVPWTKWGTTTAAGPTPTEFGDEVVAYVDAIRQVDNTTPILGLPASGCTCGYWTFDQWIADVLKVTGSKIQAVAFHEYPAGWLGSGSGTLQGFYGTLQGAAGIPTRIVSARAAVGKACSDCNISVFVSELGSALSWSSYGPYALGFSGALSIASQLTQAMDANLSNIDLFATELGTTNSWFDSSGVSHPDYTLYTQVLDHLGNESFAVSMPGLGHTLYAIDTIAPEDHGRRDMLVVNDNITRSIAFTPAFAEGSGNAPVLAWSWNGSIHTSSKNSTTWVEPFTPNPVPTAFPQGLPANFTLPPQSMVLFESYPDGGSYARLNETGVPASVPWYATVGGQVYRTTASNLTLLLSPGTYPVGSVGIPLPIDGTELRPVQRLDGFAPPLVAEGPDANDTLEFVSQWRINASATPAGGGAVTPDVTWWNASAPLSLSARPLEGYAFDRWSGWGPGSYNGSEPTVTIDPGGPITEKARFVPGLPVSLVADGLAPGTPWSVTVRGITTNASGVLATVYEPSGTYGFEVTPVAGYRILPRNGSFTVASGPVQVAIRFVVISPPGLAFPVTFRVSGLPAGATVPISVRGATETAGGWAPSFDLLNGSYAYSVGYVAGYHAVPRNKTFNVTGGPLAIDVPFVPTVYSVSWRATGLWQNVSWSVVVGGTPVAATSAWVSAELTNGSYAYEVVVPANFTASPRSGWIVVNASATAFTIVVTLAEFSTAFDADGLVGGGSWSVRLGNETLTESSSHLEFLAPNGTYTFDVHAPAGYYAAPSHGNLTVAGGAEPVRVAFHLVSDAPSAALIARLSLGALGVSAWIGAAVLGGYLLVRRLRRR